MAFSIQVIADGVILAGAFKLAVLTKKPTRTFSLAAHSLVSRMTMAFPVHVIA